MDPVVARTKKAIETGAGQEPSALSIITLAIYTYVCLTTYLVLPIIAFG